MKTMTVGEIYRAIGGRLWQGDEGVKVAHVSIDSRNIKQGNLFFALQGERFDAHDYVDQAVAGGASAIVVSRAVTVDSRVPVIGVKDTLSGLQALAAYHRRQFAVPVLGITGSSGKTTTKDMVAAVLESRWPVLKTIGNFNNEIGLPLTLLNFAPEHGAGVVEMAMRAPGEINALCQLARPTCAIITNIGTAHLERLGSLENIARAKGELLDHISPKGFALLPGDSSHAREQARRCYGKVFYYGLNPKFDIYARDLRQEGTGNRFTVVVGSTEFEVKLPLPGLHNVHNALAAAGAGFLLGLKPAEIVSGLTRVNLSGMRMEIMDREKFTIINDAYNANPDSTCAAIQSLAEVAGGGRRPVAVLGDMLELGTGAVEGHRRVGAAAVQYGVELLVCVGELSRETAAGALKAGSSANNVIHCKDKKEALAVLQREIEEGDVILVKGSRGMRMEDIVKGLLND